jgi:ribosomal protein L16 Arg81 hydroxylase
LLPQLLLLQAALDRYQTLLREYRLHKQALGDWFTGVLRQQRRQPQLLDAQATGDEALVER